MVGRLRSDSPAVDCSRPFGTGNIVAAHVATYISIKRVINLWKKDFLFTLNSSVLM